MMVCSFWRRTVSGFLFVLMVTSLLIVASPLTGTAYGVEVGAALTEWTIPTVDSLPTSLALDPSGKCCWFVESAGNKVAHLDPSTNTFREWTIPTPDSNPKGLALTMISESLVVFGTESAKNKVFIFFPDTGVFREYTLPEDSAPEHMSIEPGEAQVRAWFTELRRNAVGRITYDPSSRTVQVYELTLPTAAGGGANGVYALSGIVWFAGKSAIVRLDRPANQFTTWAIPFHPLSEAAFLDVDALGQVWYTARNPWAGSTENYVGVLRGDNTFTEWQVPTVGADLEVISINPVTGNPWVAEQGADRILKLDPSTGGVVTGSRPVTARADPRRVSVFTHIAGPVRPSIVTVSPAARTIDGSMMDEFTEWALPAGSRPRAVVVDSSGEVWILESSANKVARLSLTPDFIIECDPPSVTVMQGSNGTSTCTVTSIDGFSSAVELAGSWVGAEPSGVAYTLPTPITPPPGRGVSSTLLISAGATASTGVFTFQVSATSGPLTHNANVIVTVGAGAADFAITVSPSYLPIVPGGSGGSTIMVQSVGVFFSPVHLTGSGAPGGMGLAFGTNPVTPPIGGTASSTLTVSISGTPTGTYVITIAGTSGSLTREATLTVVVGGGACLIATATYGSELSDEVQFLRAFRDRSILKTSTGSNFMIAFNAWYYSFSPTVAQFIREHPAAGPAARVALYPLIGILRVGAAAFHLFPTNLEAGAVASGLIVSSLVGLVYLAPPLTVVLVRSTRARQMAKRLQIATGIVLLGALAAVGLITVLTGPAVMMMTATSTIVLAGLAASALFASRAMLRIAGPFRERQPPTSSVRPSQEA